MILIGEMGKARSGKTSVANAIIIEARRREYSAEIYDVGAAILKYCVSENLLPDKPREMLAPEEIKVLVDIGLKMRNFDPQYWLNRIYAEMFLDNSDFAIIPNIRYSNEVDFVKKHNGVLIHVKSLNADGSEFISTDRDPNHISETTIDPRRADFYIQVKRGDQALAEAQGVTIFNYIVRRKAQ